MQDMTGTPHKVWVSAVSCQAELSLQVLAASRLCLCEILKSSLSPTLPRCIVCQLQMPEHGIQALTNAAEGFLGQLTWGKDQRPQLGKWRRRG